MIKNQNKIDIKAIVRKCGLVRESIIHPDTLSEQEWHKIIGILAQVKQSDKFIPYSPFTRSLIDMAGKIKPKEYTLDEFCGEIDQGKTVSPGILQGGCGAINWTGQNLFMADIDNDIEGMKELSQENILNICADNNIKPSFIYESFRSSAVKRKYRVGFICNEYITDERKRKIIAKTLLVLFQQADTACANADRIFFGTNKKVIYKDYNAFFTFEQIIEIGNAKAAEKERASVNEEAVQLLQHNSSIDLNYEIRKFDLLSYLQSNCGEISHNGANYYMFHYCPICGGHDDLVYYHDSRLFTCFGKNGRKTGNIINFLMETKNMTKSEAVKYFLYDMLGYERPNYNQLSPSKAVLSSISAEISKLCNIFHTLKTPPDKYSTDDKGLGELFAAAVKDFLRYNRTNNKWMYYNEKVWIDDTGDCAVNKWAKHFTESNLDISIDYY